MWAFYTIVVVVGQAPVAYTTAVGSTVSIITWYVSDHSLRSGYTGEKAASSSLVPVQMISSIYL